MEMQHACFSPKHSSDSSACRYTLKFSNLRLGRTMIRYRDFTCSKDLVNEDQVLLQSWKQSSHRNLIGTTIDKRGNSLIFKSLGLYEKRCHGSGDRISPQTTNDRRRPCSC